MIHQKFAIPAVFLAISLIMGHCSNRQITYQQKAAQLHEQILTLDSHTDTPLMLARRGFDIGVKNNPRQRGGKVDFPRMQEGGLDAAFFAVFLSQGESSEQAWNNAHSRALRIFESIHNAVAENADVASIALKPNDAYQLKKQGKRAIYIGLENAYPIGNDLNRVLQYYHLGARYITLSHTRNNHFADSSNDPDGPIHNGLSEQGRELVKLMNSMGMMIDVSHVSDKAFYDVLALSALPVIASHSNARAVNDDPRNMTDEMIKVLAANGGVIQLCFLYVKETPPNPARDAEIARLRAKYNNFQNLSEEDIQNLHEEWITMDENFPAHMATVADLIDHLDHIVKLVGIDYVGIGSDFDGGGELEDCYDVSQLPNITAEMLKRGYSKEDIEKVWSGNFMRVFKQNMEAALKAAP